MSLPIPSADALAQSERLLALLRREIIAAGGWIDFARYMELALYAPGLGYYSGGARKFGPAGDFITAPEISPLFGAALARQLAQIQQASAPQVLEVGAGTGVLALDLLSELERLGALPERYDILELSGELRQRQQQTLDAAAPHLRDRVRWVDALPERYCGVVLANEVLDVMPMHRVAWRAGELFEQGVGLQPDGGLCWSERPATGSARTAATALALDWAEDYASELHLAAAAWMREWGARLECGGLLLIDYGYPRAEYYLPSRSSGSLLCYYRHRAHADPFLWPGLNDITAFVDFTAMAEAGFAAGLEIAGYTSQAQFLFNCGVLDCLEQRGPRESAAYIRAARAVQQLVAPQEMGELFKVMACTRGLTEPLLGFARGDRTHAL